MLRVLVLDDDDFEARVLGDTLRQEKNFEFRVVEATTAEQAEQIVYAASEPFDVFLFDHRLGEGPTGIDVMRRLREYSPSSEAIIFTGGDEPDIGERAYHAGAYLYLPKPIESRVLILILGALQTHRATERERDWLRALIQVTEDSQRALTVQAVQRIIVQGACDLGFQRARLWLEEPPETLVGVCQAGNLGLDNFSGFCMPIAESPYSRHALTKRKPTTFRGRELGANTLDQIFAGDGFQPPQGEWLYVPLWVGEQCLGALMLDNGDRLVQLQPYQTELVHLYGRQAVAALERARFFEAQKHNAEQLIFLHRVNTELMQLVDENEDWFWHATLTAATAEYGLGFNRAFLFLEENGTRLRGQRGIGHADCKKATRDWEKDQAGGMTLERYLRRLRAGRIKPMPVEILLRDWIWDIGQDPAGLRRALSKNTFTLLTPESVSQLPREIAEPLELGQCALIPLRLGNQIKGIVIVDNIANDEPLHETNLNHLASLLAQAVLIWDNHRQRDALNDLINLNYTIMAQVSHQSLKSTLEQVVRAVRHVSRADYVAIYPLKQNIEPVEYDLDRLAYDSDGIEPDGMVYPRPKGITAHILHTGTLAVSDVLKDRHTYDGQRLEAHSFIARAHVRALIGTPIQDVQTHEAYGVLYVDYRAPQEFKRQNILQVASFASLASVAIRNARAAQAAQDGLVARDDELRTLQNVLRESLAAGMQEEDVLLAVLNAAQDLLDLPDLRVGLFLRAWESADAPDASPREIRQEYYLNNRLLASNKESNIARGISGKALISGETQLVNDIHKPEWAEYYSADAREWFAELDVPIKPSANAAAIGVFHIASPAPNVFTADNRIRIERLASATALALDNVRRQKNLHNVLTATKSVIAPLNLEDTLKAIVTTGKDVAPGLSALTIWYRDPGTERIKLGPHFGVWKKTALEFVETDPQSVVSRVMNRATPLFAVDVAHEPILRGRFSQEEEIQSVAAFPLHSDKGIVGAMFFNYRQPHEFTPEEKDLFQLLAEIVALSVRDAAHLELVRKERERFRAQVEITKAVGATSNLNEILRGILTQLREQFRDAHVTPCVLTYDVVERELVFEPASLDFYRIDNSAHFGLTRVPIDGASIVSAIARASLKTHQVAERNVPDTTKESSYLDLRRETRSEFCITLMSGERLLGVLALESTKPNAFDSDEEELIRSVAQQISLVVDRARQTEDLSFKSAVIATTAWAADIAHDFKDDVARIRYAAYDLANDPALLPEHLPLVDTIEKSAELLANTMNVALLEHKKDPENVVLDDALPDWIKDLTHSRGPHVTPHFDLGSQGIAVRAHPSMLQRIVRHLVRNALDATYDPITLTVRTRALGNRWIETQIEDNGPGVPEDLQRALFHAPVTTKGKERGNGLLFVRSAVESMGGTVRLLRSRPHQSTVFAFRVPQNRETEE